jgi:hypothetical protein
LYVFSFGEEESEEGSLTQRRRVRGAEKKCKSERVKKYKSLCAGDGFGKWAYAAKAAACRRTLKGWWYIVETRILR